MVNRRIRRFRLNRNQPPPDPHRYQPFAREERPPQHPKTHRLKKAVADSRDDDAASPRSISRRDHGDNGGYSSDGSVNTLTGRPYRNNDPITVVTVSLKQSLKIQKQKLGIDHPEVSKAIHSLALEYKTQGKLNKAVKLLKEGMEILDQRLKAQIEENENNIDNDDDSRCSTETRMSVQNAPDARKMKMIRILEEKSTLYSCLGNIYRMRKLYREALDYYVKSCDMLVEAGYSGESKRVTMLVRIMRRTEVERTNRAKAPVRNVPTIQRISLEALS